MTPSDMPVRQLFGNWTSFLAAVDAKPKKWIPTQNGVTRLGTRNKNRKTLINHYGYAEVFEPQHPVSKSNGYVLLHRKLAYDAGLLTDLSMEINHINGNKLDNRIENFEVLTKQAHAKISTPLGSKRPRRSSVPCKECPTLTASKYGLCTKHYRALWDKANRTGNPDLLEAQRG